MIAQTMTMLHVSLKHLYMSILENCIIRIAPMMILSASRFPRVRQSVSVKAESVNSLPQVEGRAEAPTTRCVSPNQVLHFLGIILYSPSNTKIANSLMSRLETLSVTRPT